MTRTIKGEKRIDTPEAAQSFLNVVRAFEDSKPDCSHRTSFGALINEGIKAALTNKVELMRDFGLTKVQVDKAKSGQSLGLAKEVRERIILELVPRAQARLG